MWTLIGCLCSVTSHDSLASAHPRADSKPGLLCKRLLETGPSEHSPVHRGLQTRSQHVPPKPIYSSSQSTGSIAKRCSTGMTPS